MILAEVGKSGSGARRLARVAGLSRASKQDEVKEDGGCEDSCGSGDGPTLVVLPPRQAGPHSEPMHGDVGPEDVHPDGENQDQKRRVEDAVALAPGLVERADSLAAEVKDQGQNKESQGRQPELPVVFAVEHVT